MAIGSLFLIVALFSGTYATRAEATGFSDLRDDHAAYDAVMYLVERGVVHGYPDQTFRPDQQVNRAEALKLIVIPIAFEEQLKEKETSSYSDVSSAEWYFPFVERGFRSLGIIDGPPKTAHFHPERTVITAEFLKMLFLAHRVDLSLYNDISTPLSRDVPHPEEWYYPFVRFALSASVLEADGDFALSPGKHLTRSDVAELIYRFLRYRENRRTQALLDQTEREILFVLSFLEEGKLDEAEYASSRALLTSRGALHLQADEPLVQGVTKIAEGFRSLVKAYRAGTLGHWNDVIEQSGSAWRSAGDAQYIANDIKPIASEMMRLAKQMADEARSTLEITPVQEAQLPSSQHP
jgi:hypothetical protein